VTVVTDQEPATDQRSPSGGFLLFVTVGSWLTVMAVAVLRGLLSGAVVHTPRIPEPNDLTLTRARALLATDERLLASQAAALHALVAVTDALLVLVAVFALAGAVGLLRMRSRE
jgi:hypothetical protein